MQSYLTTFLIKCDTNGQITEVYWHKPVYLISPFQKQLSDLFDESDHRLIYELINKAQETKIVMECQRELTLRSPQVKVSLCVMAIENQILIMGLDAGFINREESESSFKFIIQEFMKLIKVTDQEFQTSREKTIRLQFEQIQKLNNKLVNAQRQLSKANAELNLLNGYLNNRLVKDDLTGLVSRYQYRAEIEMRIREQPDQLGIFIFMDIDHFKQVNDTYGHRTGDAYLQIFSRRLQEVDYSSKICMRISGDEFGLYLHGFSSVDDSDMTHIWNEIETKVLSTPAIIEGISIPIRCSAGMVIFGIDTSEIYDLIEYADFAMYQAKKQGKNHYQRFDRNQYRQGKSP